MPERDGVKNGRTPWAGRKIKFSFTGKDWKGNWREGAAPGHAGRLGIGEHVQGDSGSGISSASLTSPVES